MKCVLCELTDTLEIIREKLRHGIERKVFRCTSCGLVFLDHQEKNLQEFYLKEYRKLYSPVIGKEVGAEETFAMYLPFSQNRLAPIRHLLHPSMRVLEIGSSAGQFLYALRPYAQECMGVEFDEVFAKFTQEKLGLKTYTTPLEQTDLQPESFDLICALEVFEHIEEPLKFLETMRRYLKPGGIIYFEVPNHDDSLLSVFDVPDYRDFYYREPHLFYYSPATLKQMLAKGGFAGTVSASGFEPNMLNQLNWILTGKPQASAALAYGVPMLPFASHAAGGVREEFTHLIMAMHNQYRDFLDRNLLGSHVVFIGKKASS